MGPIQSVFAVLALVLLGALGFGATQPVAHVASRSKRIPARPERVWRLIADPVASKGWGGNVKTEVVEEDPPRRRVTKIVGESAFGGTWTFEIAPEGHDASTVTITERGEVYNPLFRTVMKAMGPSRGIEGYLAKLERAVS